MNFPARKTQNDMVKTANSPLTSLLLRLFLVGFSFPTGLIGAHFAQNSLVVKVALLLSLSFVLEQLLLGWVDGGPEFACL